MITIVTDSTVCIKKSEAQKFGIKVVPISYFSGNSTYYESFSDCNGEFEALFKKSGTFQTAHPNPSAYLSTFQEICNEGNEILCITISSRLSGAYSSAHMAAQLLENKKSVMVVDSQLTAGGLYLLVERAVKLANEGLSLREIYEKLLEIRQKITIAFSVDDMMPLRNSGRIGLVRMSVGTILNRRPILLCKDGAVVSDSVARGNTEMIKTLFSKIAQDTTEVVINYVKNSLLASNLYNIIKQAYPHIEIKLMKAGPILGIHVGLSVVAISFIAD